MTDHTEKTTGCEVADDLLSAYLDDELDATETKFVQDHVVDCEICPRVLDDMESTMNTLATLPKEAIPEHDLWDDIVARYDGSDIVSLDTEREKRGWFGMTKGQLIAAGIGILMLPGVFAGGLMVGMASDKDRSDRNGIVRVVDRPTAPRAAPAPRPSSAPVVVIPSEPTPPDIGGIVSGNRVRGRNSSARSAVEAGLIRALRDPSAEVSRQAAMSLAEMDDLSDAGVAALVDALHSNTNGETRRWAAYALGEIGSDEAVPALSQTLITDNYAPARRWAAYALAEINEESALPALIHGLEDSNAEVRRWSAYGLGEIADPAAAAALTNALDDSNSEVRRWAAWALSEIADDL